MSIREAGGILPLVRLLSDANCTVREQTAGALMNVSVNAEKEVSTREAGGISALKNLVSDANYSIRDYASSVLELLGAK